MASRFSLPNSSFLTPPLYFIALTVANYYCSILGLRPANLDLISKNFSAPRSAPKPALAKVYSANFKASFVATWSYIRGQY